MRSITLTIVILSFWQSASGNDVQPRLYNNIPYDMSFVTLAYSRSVGEVSLDSSLPLEGVDGRVSVAVLNYTRGLKLGAFSGMLSASLPYGNLSFTGLYFDEPARADRRGYSDPVIQLGVNLGGAPPITRAELAQYRQKLIVGVSVEVRVPLGQYDPGKLINMGSNRWSVLPQIGMSYQTGRWTLEAAVGRQWFSDNDETAFNQTLSQERINLTRGTVIYTAAPGWRIGGGFLYTRGGASARDGVRRDDAQDNWRTGIWTNIPLARRHQLNLLATRGIINRIGSGSNFTTWSVGYTYQF